MAKYILIACLLGRAGALHAQTQTQIELKQIAALALYAQEAKKGYEKIHAALKNIKNIKEAEYALHQIFYAALAGINPQIFFYVENHDPLGSAAWQR
jgi:hypothetical protein